MTVVFWGTYDTGKPRNRILLAGLRRAGVKVLECHADVWRGVEDKSRIAGIGAKIWWLVKWLACYPALIVRYLRLPAHDCVVVGYLGHLDVMVIRPFARLRGVPVCWDAFVSIYNTVVEDRSLVRRGRPLAGLLYAWEWLACRMADRIIMDTRAHGRYLEQQYSLPAGKVETVPVGAETDLFFPDEYNEPPDNRLCRILCYGQFAPMHGLPTILKAARILRLEPVQWTLIGQGQEQEFLEREVTADLPITWLPWVPYSDLRAHLLAADIALGVFGDTDKAHWVIPNKVYQAIACLCPVITMDSPAIRELVGQGVTGVILVPPADPEALAAAIRNHCVSDRRTASAAALQTLCARITPEAVGRRFAEVLRAMVAPHADKDRRP